MFSFFLRKIKNPAGEVRCRRVAAIQLTVRDGRAPRGSHGEREAIAGRAPGPSRESEVPAAASTHAVADHGNGLIS